MAPLGAALALAFLRWDVRCARPTRDETALSVLPGGQLAAFKKKAQYKSLLQQAANDERARLERAGVRGAGEFVDEVLKHAQASVRSSDWDAALAVVPDDALEAAIAELTSTAGVEQRAQAGPPRAPATNAVKALVEKSAIEEQAGQKREGVSGVPLYAAAQGVTEQGGWHEHVAKVGVKGSAAHTQPCVDVSSQVGLNCDMPVRCHNLPSNSSVPEIQSGIQRVLEKCYEYHNTCKAAAHEFMGMAAKRRLIMAKIEVMKSGVSLAKKQFHERVARLKEKNETIYLLAAGVGKMNATVTMLQGKKAEEERSAKDAQKEELPSETKGESPSEASAVDEDAQADEDVGSEDAQKEELPSETKGESPSEASAVDENAQADEDVGSEDDGNAGGDG